MVLGCKRWEVLPSGVQALFESVDSRGITPVLGSVFHVSTTLYKKKLPLTLSLNEFFCSLGE